MAGVNGAVEAGGGVRGLLRGVAEGFAVRQRLLQFSNVSFGEGCVVRETQSR